MTRVAARPWEPPRFASLDALIDLMTGRRFAVLTGAGCSTESGIPDYRGPETRRRARNPIEYRAFVGSAEARRRYWARSLAGWPRMRAAAPNAGHAALAALEASGRVTGLVTQNVDRLHHRAGSEAVVELHGALAEARCLGCGAIEDRDGVQARLQALNPGFEGRVVEHAPDGDAEVDVGAWTDFVVADCLACGGILKPNVVFFGESVPRETVARAFEVIDGAEGLLVVGTSLAVYSGLRFVRHAAALGRPVAMVNLGAPSRGAELAELHVDGPSGQVLPALAEALGVASRPA